MSLYLPLYLRDRNWRISYSSNENNPITDFYIPALECTTQYDRKSGFFSSAILSKVARGLGAMLQNQGQMRLIMGCQFSPQDLQAIQQGYTLRDTLLTRLDANLKPPETFTQLKHFEILSWLIQNSYLDIKIAIPVKDNEFPIDSQPLTVNSQSLAPNHYYIFHEKVGIFTDKNGDQIAISGSNNESLNGWENNTESFHVYCSWEGGRDLERVAEEQFRFEQLWNDLAPNVRIFDVPEAIKKKLLHYAPATKPTWNHQAELNSRLLTANNQPLTTNNQPLTTNNQPLTTNNQAINPEEKQAFQSLINLHQHPGCLDFCLKSIPIKPWPHQIKILRRVAQQFPRSFLIADEVGLGKTIETGLILRYLLISQKVKRVLILSPASIQPQWQEELREKFNLHFWSYSQNQFIPANNCQSTVKIQSLSNPWNTHNLILASSHLVRRAERMGELLAAEPWDLIILDEAHHARRKSPQNRKETPNRLLQLMQQLRAKTRSLMLLSATPMQIDTIEIFDLLNLLGLQGHWLYGENFCNYFASLSEQPDGFSLDFLQQMSTDYFQKGGLPCPRFDQYLTKNDRLISYRLRDTWQKGQRISNPKHCLEDQAFITASRQYLTINNPLKDLMFRHTRDTLREYYRHGLLDREIPERKVQDNAITLEPNREIPLYRAVSDYVRHFYKLAQKEHRKALGFLMTLYRKRLTSSFYAIKESLQRRLDGINITPDDLGDLEDADDPIIEGLESYFEPVDPQEIQYLENLLQQFENTGEDSKLSHFITILRQELIERESAIAFTQYTDTMDYLREALRQLYGSQVACYSGRGGELYNNGEWQTVPKEQIKRQFRAGEIKILLCTESASEGLNLQTCGVLINYDMPWNPMRVEQRIGRLDRIGQVYATVKIHNFYYDGTVEAKVYRKLRDRIDAFQSVVGNLQPILARVPTFIERAAMSADPEEEGVLLAEFDQVLDAPPLRPALDQMVTRDVEADLLEISTPLPPTSISPQALEQLLTNSQVVKQAGAIFERLDPQIWQLNYQGKTYQVTFYPETFDEKPSLQYMNFGNPLFEQIISQSYQ
ncbi:helicase-related protein [Kamptonema animale CS-326]|jgi:SNF2 family DNA or RNA helicase|uniref:helicase-related protein n=1 Tax=Kamptonema animale TaxID=92934 RepID=UPI00232C5B31|nr:helicase-related protein [Kamptonema animale]MDB9512841.1 helicase-related protein [Kamptonema animale CS-326]